jgi:hypothetical protein
MTDETLAQPSENPAPVVNDPALAIQPAGEEVKSIPTEIGSGILAQADMPAPTQE